MMMQADNKTDNKIVEILKNSAKTPSLTSLPDLLVDRFYSEIISQNDARLVKIIFSENVTQKDLDKFLNNWDIEVAGSHKALLLSYFMKSNPDLKFTQYEKPRLTGLLNFYRFQNLKLIAHYTKIGQRLNQENIPLMILKGGAMKYIRPELSRHMGDIDILVAEKDYQKVASIVQSMGYECDWDIHSVDLHQKGSEEGIMDIHKYIFMNTGYETKLNKGLFKRAKMAKVFGVDSFVPCHEDILFIALVNLARNLRENTSSAGILFTIFDCKYLLESKPDFDWKIVINNAQKTKTEVQLSFAIKFINRISPSLLPDKIIKNRLFEKESDDYCTLVMYNRFYLYDKKMRCRELKILDALKNFDILKEYIALKPKYFILKSIRKNPVMARFILNLIQKYKYRGINEN